MPTPLIKSLAKKSGKSIPRAEKMWRKAKDIVAKEYGEENYALVAGITKKMLGLKESIQDDEINELLAMLFKARDVTHKLHWGTKSFSVHMALGDLYETLIDLADELAEMYMGKYGDLKVPESTIQFTMNPEQFIIELSRSLEAFKSHMVQDGWFINKYEELQGEVQRVAYKIKNLR
jgi:hypothetical protein